MINLLFPKYYKYKKIHNSSYSLNNKLNNINLNYGLYGIISKSFGSISSSQLESIRFILNKNIKKISKIWTIIYPNFPISKKSKSSRMGSGVGLISYWVYKVSPGSVIFEIEDIKFDLIKNIFNKISCRFPFKVCLVKKNYF
ncbi:ribosomal protein L16 (apicoplast) [Babesia microti strain RI]|uniref:Ribosomal protein L16 n=1 Tax=Babesia microti (strain RI) TaxID=1133968 RepID=A0A068W969_BABMR|nr:ribosomal protein L16 [Babesia microti strain RI]CDR32591.1 ribosomal protein L16 [Babesia microti strain RI]|eukprot:YP_009363160.1 ribosomal protein L16 (apicoplast) [Babesia microti strain RI]